jgi:hypothetical protein
MGTVLSIRTQLQEDPQRITVTADLVGDAPPPSMGKITVSATMQIWVDDNPTWQALQLRVMDTLARSFALADGLRPALGGVYATDQTPTAASPSG